MWSIGGIVLLGALASWLEVPRLRKAKLYRELWTFSLLMLFGTGLAIMQSLHLPLPNPLNGVILIYQPFSDFLYGKLPQ
ncbi:MAG: hypothetical protein ACXVP5_01430 [Tumebacillaceae bacterium]